MPVLLYQVWAFVAPGLTQPSDGRSGRGSRWRWCSSPSASASSLVLPYAVAFLLSFTDDKLVANIAQGPYFDFVTTMFLAFGLVLEFPILLVGLSRVGIVTSERCAAAPLRAPRHRDLRGGRDARWRPRQPVRARRHDVPPVRGDDPVHQADGPVTQTADEPVTEGSAEQAVVILSGLSGGGKTAAAKLFEDLGYMVVDNLPGELLPELAERVADDPDRFAGWRSCSTCGAGDPALALGAMRGALEGAGSCRASSSSRRATTSSSGASARPAIATRSRRARHRELDRGGAALLDPIRAEADVIVDTSDLSLRQLRERLFAQLARRRGPTSWPSSSISFGFKYGVPLEADLVFDVRFIPNPYYVPGAAAALRADRGGPRLRPGQPMTGASSTSSRSSSTSRSRPTSTRARPG